MGPLVPAVSFKQSVYSPIYLCLLWPLLVLNDACLTLGSMVVTPSPLLHTPKLGNRKKKMLLPFALLHWNLSNLVGVSGQALEEWCLPPLPEQLGRRRNTLTTQCAVTRKIPSTTLSLRSPALWFKWKKVSVAGRVRRVCA